MAQGIVWFKAEPHSPIQRRTASVFLYLGGKNRSQRDCIYQRRSATMKVDSGCVGVNDVSDPCDHPYDEWR